MRVFYNIYQYVAFLIIYPFSLYLWYQEFENWDMVFFIIIMPLIVSYVIPFLGTNVTKLWSFNTKFKLGNFRIYHGFVLGAIMNVFGYLLYKISPNYTTIIETIFFAIISGSFIAFWNWYYDIYAVKSGFIVVNNKLAYEGKSAHEIVTDYAPVYFFCFGFIYGIYIKIIEYQFEKELNNLSFAVIITIIAALVIPTLIHMIFSYMRYQNIGISKYKGE